MFSVCQELCSVLSIYISSFPDEPEYLVSLIYIFQVENWCPHLPWRAKNPYEEADHNSLVSDFGNLLPSLWFGSDANWYMWRLLEIPAMIWNSGKLKNLHTQPCGNLGNQISQLFSIYLLSSSVRVPKWQATAMNNTLWRHPVIYEGEWL